MKRIAAPMVGGIFTSFLLELLVYPAIYQIWRWNTAVKHQSEVDGELVASGGALATESS
jgi:Cu(I)/Ag(I) efflux system membrane protein CusA/SilA